MPIEMPAIRAIGNERNRATSAVAIAARIRFGMTETWSVAIGAIRIAARPANAEPRIQLATAIRSGDQPIAAAARSFSATAEVAMPKRVNLYSAQRMSVSAAA